MGMGGGSKKTPKGTPATPKKPPVINSDSDTGSSQTDGITATNPPTLRIAKLSKGTVAQLRIDGQLVESTQTVDAKGMVFLTPTKALSEGTHTITYHIQNAAGKVSGSSPQLTMVIDTIAPDAPLTAPDMTEESDTGASHSDNITTNATPDFFIGGLSKGTTAQLVVDGKVVAAVLRGPDANGHYFLTPSTALSSGVHHVSYNYKDVAGNVSANSPILTLTVGDAVVLDPINAPDMLAQSDTGISHIDDITSATTPTFSIGLVPLGVTAQLVIDGHSIESISMMDAQGNTLLTPVHALTTGAHRVAYQFDNNVTGNVSKISPRLDIVVNSDDQYYTISLDAIGTDTGLSDSDFITNNNAIVFSGRTNAPAGTFVGIELTDAMNVAHFIGLVRVLGDNAGRWSFDYANATNRIDSISNNVPDGSYSIDYYIADEKGNRLSAPKTDTSFKELIVDSSQAKNYFSPPHDDPNYLYAAIAITGVTSDTGVNGDMVTSDKNVIVSGTVTHFSTSGEAHGDTVSVQILDQKNTVVAQALVTPQEGSGAWSLTHELTTLADGRYTIKAVIVDLAGNEVKAAPTRTLIIDSTAPGQNNDGTMAAISIPVITIPEATNGNAYSSWRYIIVTR